MAKLSVVIVNYNVKYFLEQALLSVRKAARGMDVEIWAVDNASSDGSVEMVGQKFPEVRLIANEANVGFSKANNQAIRQATGEYILLLNPDTVVEEDTFQKTVGFMDAHPGAGALGVKMLDGKGNFLPESKRAFPSPRVAFFKAFGLSALFPKSKIFAQYHLGYLDENEVHEVDVLAGAFLLARKSVLDKTGLLDEDFFMYGEDIDLSYRIVKAGYKNYYFPESRIIHYKGESTKKGSLNYVRMFYNAMIIFAQKHFKKRKANLFTALIRVAVYFRAFLSVLVKFFAKIYWALIDFLIIYAGIFLIKEYWESMVKYTPEYYPREYMLWMVPAYILVWIISIFFSGGYDKPYRISKTIRGIIFGTVVILAVYGLLSEEYRYSRAIIALGAGWAAFAALFTRLAYYFIKNKQFDFNGQRPRNLVIAGSYEESKRALTLLKQAGVDSNFIGFVLPEEPVQKEDHYLGDEQELEDIVEVYGVNEIIFCSRDIPSQSIIRWMTRIGRQVDYKIIPEDSYSIIGSNSKNSAGDLYAIDVNLAIASPAQRRNKRVFDLVVCLGILATLPVSIWFVREKGGLARNWVQVFFGQKSWVGYHDSGQSTVRLPPIKEGVLSPPDGLGDKQLSPQTVSRLNLIYAKDYNIPRDWNIIRKGFVNIGR